MKRIFSLLCIIAWACIALAEPVMHDTTPAPKRADNAAANKPTTSRSNLPGFSVVFDPPSGTTPPSPSLFTPPQRSTRPSWNAVKTWAIQTGKMPKNLERIAFSNVDMGIISRMDGHAKPYEKNEVLQAKRNKWLLAYLNVGEAQSFEWYFKELFYNGKPNFALERNKRFDTNYRVLLDSPIWINIVLETLDRIIAQGFDGVELDVLDVYWHKSYPGGESKENMAKGVKMACTIALYARARNPEFKIVVNNATNLIKDFPEYRKCVDGTIGESVWWFNTGVPRDKVYTTFQLEMLNLNAQAGVKVFVVDKTSTPEHAAFVMRESLKRQWIPFVSNWFLDFFPLEPQILERFVLALPKPAN